MDNLKILTAEQTGSDLNNKLNMHKLINIGKNSISRPSLNSNLLHKYSRIISHE